MGNLVTAEGLMVADILQVYLHDLEGFGGIPVDKGAGAAGATATKGRDHTVTVAAEDVVNGGPG